MQCTVSFHNVVLSITLFIACIVKAQTVQQFNVWVVPVLNFKLHPYVNIATEGHFRFHNLQQNQQHIARGWLEVFPYKNIALSPVGYAYIWNYRYGELPVAIPENEHRLFEQVTLRFTSGKWQWNNRIRLEQRWIEDNISNPAGEILRNGFTYSNRLRFRLATDLPLGKKQQINVRTFYLSAWEEVFISFGRQVTYRLPDQNRAYLGAGYRFNNNGAVTLGYMHQLLLRSNATQIESNHTMWLGFQYDINMMKRKRS